MQNWTSESWQAALLGLVVGVVLAYIILRLTKGSIKKQVQTETELQKAKTELDTQKQQLEKHFAESADLLKVMAQDYQKLYRHLASTSNELLPELSDKSLFPQNLLGTEASTAKKLEEDDQPRDYSEGSSGILKPER
ncbi:MAG TPA: DUF1043 domain-containing protein [Pasteurellaceae bacterium]|nr:DUF1043 domain-containing protein [Pasteurellaceae bacterium]